MGESLFYLSKYGNFGGNVPFWGTKAIFGDIWVVRLWLGPKEATLTPICKDHSGKPFQGASIWLWSHAVEGICWSRPRGPFVRCVNKSWVARMVTCPSSSRWVCLKIVYLQLNRFMFILMDIWWVYPIFRLTKPHDCSRQLGLHVGSICEKRGAIVLELERRFTRYILTFADPILQILNTGAMMTSRDFHIPSIIQPIIWCIFAWPKKTAPRTDHTYWRHGEESEEPRSNWPRRGLRCFWDRGWRFESHSNLKQGLLNVP